MNETVTLGSLLSSTPDQFIYAAYAAVLNRKPDPTGLAAHHLFLKAGGARVVLLANLLASAEASACATPDWAGQVRLKALIARLPFVGGWLGWDSNSAIERRLRALEYRLDQGVFTTQPLNTGHADQLAGEVPIERLHELSPHARDVYGRLLFAIAKAKQSKS